MGIKGMLYKSFHYLSCQLSSLNQLSSTYTAKPRADAAATIKTATCTENDEAKASRTSEFQVMYHKVE